MEILIDAEAKFPREAAIPIINLACTIANSGRNGQKAKRYLKEAFGN